MPIDLWSVPDPAAAAKLWHKLNRTSATLAIACGAEPAVVKKSSGLPYLEAGSRARRRPYNYYAQTLNRVSAALGYGQEYPLLQNESITLGESGFDDQLIEPSLKVCRGARDAELILRRRQAEDKYYERCEALALYQDEIDRKIEHAQHRFTKAEHKLLEECDRVWPSRSADPAGELRRTKNPDKLYIRIISLCNECETAITDLTREHRKMLAALKNDRFNEATRAVLHSNANPQLRSYELLRIPKNTFYNHKNMPKFGIGSSDFTKDELTEMLEIFDALYTDELRYSKILERLARVEKGISQETLRIRSHLCLSYKLATGRKPPIVR
ncbi:hypothetical protein I3U51_21925 [Mycobacteroides abscessus subsp. abscessus]|uniref:hypothetical protein n=1 Tax=Mycobacteroides abscessus TaxID=36809 RepID=UPI0019D1F1EA|nr:hypothetical protein [Mycobacteroides abscessus]MBN7443197.1 hypothetical protein [Mycobacteroides abscessus subsp. abscessus]